MNHPIMQIRILAAAFLSLAWGASASGQAPKLQVYILAGQSNMEGHARVSTIDYIGEDPKTAPLLKMMKKADGTPVVCDDVWISYLTGSRQQGEGLGKLTAGFGSRRNPTEDGGKIGPEFTFGLRVRQASQAPVLLIKAAWGGKSLHTNFRSPSAGPHPLTPADLARLKKKGEDIEAAKAKRATATGYYYRQTIAHVKKVLADPKRVCPAYDPEVGFELAGFVWFQGFNDMVDRRTYPERDKPGGYADYSTCMAHLIRDVRKDLKAPKLPFVIGVMGVGGPIQDGDKKRNVHRHFRAAMAAPAALPEFQGNVTAVPTSPFWDMRLDAIAKKLDKVKRMNRMLRTKNKKGPNKDGSMSKAEQRKFLDKYRVEVVGAEDLATYKRGASNAGYHYLGCAKTMAQIGVAFADAMIAMRQSAR